MAEPNPSPETEHTCSQCGVNSQQRALLSGEYQGKPIWVCVGCLPRLIHGAH
jgi:ribosomal protein L37AE/L43A